MAGKVNKAVQSPLQLFGLYLAWAESALAASLFATDNIVHWTKYFLIFVMAVGLIAYVIVAGFLLIYLVIKQPHFLFNPSDYDKTVQPMLFGITEPSFEAKVKDRYDESSRKENDIEN